MLVFGVLITIIVAVAAIVMVIIAVKFGVQWAISSQLPVIKKYMGHDPNESEEDKRSAIKEAQQQLKRFRFKHVLSHPMFRLFFIGVICVLSIIPITILEDVISDRSYYASRAMERVSKSWGGTQLIRGPVVIVPYQELVTIQTNKKNDKGETVKGVEKVWRTKQRMFLPDTLELTADMKTQMRISGIYPVPVYATDLRIAGELPKLSFEDKSSSEVKVNWEAVTLSVGVSDSIGLKRVGLLNVMDSDFSANPGLPSAVTDVKSGFYYQFNAKNCAKNNCSFGIDLTLHGTESFKVSSVGKLTGFNMTSDWPHPKFTGDGLPDEKQISDEGFEAQWQISNFVRSYPQVSDNINLHSFNEYTVGVELIQPVNPHSMSNRAVKYGLLVIGLTLIGMFVFEQVINKRLHVVQYFVVTSALSLFYLTLLSLSEHIGFLSAWVVASIVITLMVSGYVGMALKKIKQTSVLALFIIAIYTTVYALLRMQDYALLVGTIVLLIILSIVMMVTYKMSYKEEVEE